MKRRADTGKWQVRWRENGRNRSKSFTLKAGAVRFEAEVHRSRELGRPLDLDRGKETLSEFVGVFWRRYAVPSLAEKTRADYGRAWEKHIRRRVGGYRLRDVTPAVVDQLRADLVEAKVGPAMVGKVLTILSAMFRCAVMWDRVDRNPLREIRLPQPKRTRLEPAIPLQDWQRGAQHDHRIDPHSVLVMACWGGRSRGCPRPAASASSAQPSAPR